MSFRNDDVQDLYVFLAKARDVDPAEADRLARAFAPLLTSGSVGTPYGKALIALGMARAAPYRDHGDFRADWFAPIDPDPDAESPDDIGLEILGAWGGEERP